MEKKKIRFILRKEYKVLMPSTYNWNDDDGNEAYAKLEEDITSTNTTIELEFWENLHLVCYKCGISITQHMDGKEELEDGMCAQCANLCKRCGIKGLDTQEELDRGICNKCNRKMK